MRANVARHNAKAPLSLAAEFVPASSILVFAVRKGLESAAVKATRAADSYKEDESDPTYMVDYPFSDRQRTRLRSTDC